MKNNIIYSLLFLITLNSLLQLKTFAQGTLQFNKVKIVTSLETVPTNKVWKIENAFGPAIKSYCSTNPMFTIKINGSTVDVGASGTLTFSNYCYGWSGVGIVTQFPI